MAQPKIKIACVANLYSREMLFEKAGDTELGHKHPFNHMTFLASGKLKVETELGVSEYTAPQMIYIHKDYIHELTALVDTTVAYCIHALRNGDGIDDIVSEDMIPEGMNAPDIFEIVKRVDL